MDGKRFHSLDYEMKRRYGEKVYRLALNGGFTCPNRDGKVGWDGCIFCSAGGSGDFASSPLLSVTEQIAQQKAMLRSKRPVRKFIAYFQAFTSTYAPVARLEELYMEAIRDPDVAILAIGTRPDELPDEVISLLGRLNQIKPVWIELGLQTIHEETAAFIRRGYPLSCFEDALRRLRQAQIEVIVHTILYLPGETPEDMLSTMHYLARQDIQGIKLSLLHVLEHTDLATLYKKQPFYLPTMEEYVEMVITILEQLPPELVIHRLTGDGPSDLLIAPDWTRNKRQVLNTLGKRMKEKDTWQGKKLLISS